MGSPIYKDRVRENCTFDTVDNVTLVGAISGYTAFDNGVTDYFIQTLDQTIWEVGEGTVVGGQLVRDTVYANSAGTLAKLDFGVVGGAASQTLSAFRASKLIQSDQTKQLEVGYTTTVEADSFADPLIPNLALPGLKLLIVTASFTLDEAASGTFGSCKYYVTATGTGPYTLTPGTGVAFIVAPVSIVVGTKYILEVTKYADGNSVAELTQIA